MQCPACLREVEGLSRNGICHDCPELMRLYKAVGIRSNADKSGNAPKQVFQTTDGRRSSSGAVIQRPSGRSGKVVKDLAVR